MSRPKLALSGDHSLTALLVFLCINLFVVQPLGRVEAGGRVFISVVFSLILVSGMGAAAKTRLTTALFAVIVGAGLTVHWLRLSSGGTALAAWDASVSLLFCSILSVVVLMQVFSDGPITSHRIQGAVAVYLLLGLTFFFGYELIEIFRPEAFAPPRVGAELQESPRLLYFSFVTLTTVGFGDITAVHPAARSLVIMEALIGQLYPTILLARLVSMHQEYRQTRHRDRL